MTSHLLRGLQDPSREPLTAHAPASLTYEPFYGLSEKPFSLSADPRFLFKSPSHSAAFDALQAGIRRREGLIVLTGEIGTGKTTLCRSVLQHLDRRTFAAFVPDPFVSREDLLKMLLVDFGVISVGDLKRGRLNGASRPDLSYPLYEFLDSLVPLQAFAVLVIDEAQNLSSSLLEEVRILSELEKREKLLQVVLVGQPELRDKLKLPQMRQVDQRVSVRCELTPLDARGVAGYVKYRLGVASDGENRVEFNDASLDAVHRGSGGVPRLINRICERALQRAYLSHAFTVDATIVRGAIDDLGLAPATGADAWPTSGSVASKSTTPLHSAAPKLREPRPEPPAAEAHPAVPPAPREDRSQLLDFEFESEETVAGRTDNGAWKRRASAAAIIAAVSFGALGGGMWYLGAQTVDGQSLSAMLPAAPPRLASAPPIVPDAADAGPRGGSGAPAAASEGRQGANYIIQVASFESPVRAERLVAELSAAGFRARDVEFDFGPPRGRLVQVIVGGYSSAIEVERDLQRIRSIPGYADARLLER